MKKSVFMDKYPIYSLELDKNEIRYSDMDEIVEYFKSKIEEHPVANNIAIFDHYNYTKDIENHKIHPDIVHAVNVVFCFGANIPNIQILAVRPRSIGIVETQNTFVIEFLEVPKEQLHKTMEDWAKALKK